MRKALCNTITVYNFEELSPDAKEWAIKNYYEFYVNKKDMSLSEWGKIKAYFEGVEFYKDGTVYEEI